MRRLTLIALLLAATLAAPDGAAGKDAGKSKPAKKPAAKKEFRIAHLRLSGAVLEAPPQMALFGPTEYMTLRDWLLRIGKARNDKTIDAVAIEIAHPQVNWAQVQELANAIARTARTKPVHTHLAGGGAMEYLLASAGRKVHLEPAGTLAVTGVGMEVLFFRGTLDKVGIRPQFVQIGKYKGASEPLQRTEPTDALKGEYRKVADDLYDQLIGQVARQRNLTVPHVKQVIDESPLKAPKAKEYRLVDSLVSRADWQSRLEALAGKDRKGVHVKHYARKDRPGVNFSNPFALFQLMVQGPKRARLKAPTVAIIHAEGMIVPGRSGETLFGARLAGAKTLVKSFERARTDKRIKAVIFRIDSPGGSALASEMIYAAVRKCAAEKPVIASIARMGASGGYYVAAGAKRILADPAALVGSIGVVSGKLAMGGLYDRLGVGAWRIARGKNAGLWMSDAWTKREQEVIRRLARKTYKDFVDRVREGRGKKIEDVSKVARGRIFTARQAAENGLIDATGGMREAVVAAHKAAGIKSSYFVSWPEPKSLADVLSGDFDSRAPFEATQLGLVGELIRARPVAARLLATLQLLGSEHVLTVVPHEVSVRLR